MHLLKGDFKGPRRLVEFIGASNLRIEECSALPDLAQAVLLMEKYADTPMAFADATLILLADVRKVRQICTLDRRGFTTFRSLDGKSFTMVPAG
jgi:predicted nucleic acid-binding protein